VLSVVAIAITALLLLALCRGDPKRRRAARSPGAGLPASTRRTLAAAACLPGIVLASLGDAAAFLIWLGGSAAIGWMIALWFGRRRAAELR